MTQRAKHVGAVAVRDAVVALAMVAGVISVLAVVAGCRDSGSPSSPPTSSAGPLSSPVTVSVTPSGFGTVSATVVGPDGDRHQVCLWLADSAERRQRGLMGVTDLGGFDGMLFAFEERTSSGFWMKDTPLPLSVAFYDGGRFVSSTDMQPCPRDAACPTYAAAGPYERAVEVPQGDLARLGLVTGSRLEVGTQRCAP